MTTYNDEDNLIIIIIEYCDKNIQYLNWLYVFFFSVTNYHCTNIYLFSMGNPHINCNCISSLNNTK